MPEAGPGGPRAVGVAVGPAVVAVPATHPLARRRELDLADLADAYWIDAPEVAPFGRLPVDGLRAGLRYDGADTAVLAGLVAAGHGLAVLPLSLVSAHPGLARVPICAPTRLVHRVELVRNSNFCDIPDLSGRLGELLGAVT